MQEVTVNGWVREYVFQLFVNRGYQQDDDETLAIVDAQWQNWKRLMVKHGLNADQGLAEEIAFEFGCKMVKGGAGRIFEHFAEFVAGRPRPVREKEFQVQRPAGVYCPDCEDRGYIGVPMIAKSGQKVDRTHRCHCLAGVKYAAFPEATPEMLDRVLQEREAENRRLGQWCLDRGIPVGPDAEFRRGFRKWVDAQGGMTSIFKPVSAKKPVVNEEAVLASW